MNIKNITLGLLLSFSLILHSEPIDIPQYDDLNKARLSSQQCLTVNLYHESRSESDIANMMIIMVVLNRADDTRYPNDICSVVFQRKQFSWTSDKLSDKINDEFQYERLYRLVEQALLNKEFLLDMSEGVTHYHTVTSNPYWSSSKRLQYINTIDNHKFYRRL